MGILDEAIREHLELKRQHGADESELRGLENEAFGPADRPGDKYDSPAVQVLANGLPTVYEERAARAALVCDPVLITIDLGLGDASATVWGCDLTAEYVSMNAHYTT